MRKIERNSIFLKIFICLQAYFQLTTFPWWVDIGMFKYKRNISKKTLIQFKRNAQIGRGKKLPKNVMKENYKCLTKKKRSHRQQSAKRKK